MGKAGFLHEWCRRYVVRVAIACAVDELATILANPGFRVAMYYKRAGP